MKIINLTEIIELAKDGLYVDGSHHKQWYLEKILAECGGEFTEDELEIYGSPEPGIPA